MSDKPITAFKGMDKNPRLSVAYVGENGIKADTYYKLDKAGEFVEVEA